MRAVSLLGSTGSVGTQALDVVRRSQEAFAVRSLAANADAEGVAKQVEEFGAARAALVDDRAAARLRKLSAGLEVLEGEDGVVELAHDPDADIVLNAVAGAAGLRATLAALEAGRHVALANKESCVAGGPLVMDALRNGGGRLVPVDSEHASVHMCLRGEQEPKHIVLTASGGPFRARSTSDLADVTPDDALAHPTWDMGAKITVDSATLMNKGLEVIEAHVLFGVPYERIEVVVHPQSVIHCLVEFVDGSWKSGLGPPDMRVPIAYAMGYPERIAWSPERVDWSSMRDLTFEPVDTTAFPCLGLAYDAGRAGGTAPAVLNAANEIAVQAFLDGRIGFLGIPELVRAALEAGASAGVGYGDRALNLDAVLAADAWARREAERRVAGA